MLYVKCHSYIRIMERKKVVCDSLLFSYQEWKWVWSVRQLKTLFRVLFTVPATGDLTDPVSFLWKINPRFHVWTHFNAVLLLQAYLKVEYPKKYSQGQIIPGIIQQAVMPADHRDELFSARTRCKIPVLTTKSFPHQLLIWAQRQLLQFTFLPSSLQHPPGDK